MPGRKLREIRADRALRAFAKAGYALDRVAGSHYILVGEGSPVISIPRHSTIKFGLLLAKIKAAGMT